MTSQRVESIARAVLYEGYALYPYRPSSVKNQKRFNFGVLSPLACSRAQRGAEASSMQTECLVRTGRRTALEVRVRFLHLLARELAEVTHPAVQLPHGTEPTLRAVASLEVGGQLLHSWQEAVEREVTGPSIDLDALVDEPQQLTFTFPELREAEPLCDTDGPVV